MNERIRELARRVVGKHRNDVSSISLFDEQIEKFAELIVRECLDRGNNLAKHYIDNHSEKEQTLLLASIADYSNEIRKHFGVKE